MGSVKASKKRLMSPIMSPSLGGKFKFFREQPPEQEGRKEKVKALQ